MWIPATAGGLLEYTAADWERLWEFVEFLLAAIELDGQNPPDWSLSLDDWLKSLSHIKDDFKEEVIKPFMYQFVSLGLDRVARV